MSELSTHLPITLHPVFLEDYFVKVTYYAEDTQHISGFWPLSYMADLPGDYLKRFHALIEDPDKDYIQKTDHNVFEIEEYFISSDRFFFQIGEYFSCQESIYYMVIIRCVGWRFEYRPDPADTSKIIHMPWQIQRENVSQEKAEAHIRKVLTGEENFVHQYA